MRFSIAVFVMLVIIIVCFSQYSNWKEARPWGAINKLATGSVHFLKKTPIYMGRNVKNIGINTVSFSPTYVSRIHLVIDKNLQAIDMRTLNGTTVNSDFLAYGETKELENGDIIVLADVAPFQFQKISYAPYQFWNPAVPQGKKLPPGAWGMFLDLVSKEVTYLTEVRYFIIDSGQKNISITTDKTDNWICAFGINRSGYIEIEDREDAIHLYAEVKTGDTYTYRAGLVPPGEEFYYFEWEKLGWKRTRGRDDMREREREALGICQAVFHTSTRKYFRILNIVSDLEPE